MRSPESSENRESSSLNPWTLMATKAFLPCWTKALRAYTVDYTTKVSKIVCMSVGLFTLDKGDESTRNRVSMDLLKSAESVGIHNIGPAQTLRTCR